MKRVLVASGNPIKLEEIRQLIPDLKTLAVELIEIQSPDPGVVVRHKLDQVAALGLANPIIVEDTGLALAAWRGLPGALVKWFVDELGAQSFAEAARAGGATTSAEAVSAVGVTHGGDQRVWVGRLAGNIVDSRGDLGGWTSIFEVAGTRKTLAEMTFEERMNWTMRRAPLESARTWLAGRGQDGFRE